MAGAMRLGELTHRMESRLEDDDALAAPGTGAFDLLESDLDRIAFVLDALREGRVNVALPWSRRGGRRGRVPRRRHGRPCPTRSFRIVAAAAAARRRRRAGRRRAARRRAVRGSRGRRNGRGRVRPARAAARSRRHHRPAGERSRRGRDHPRAHRRRAARAEGEPAGAHGSVIRLRAQVREIEIQGESQIQSRMSHVGESGRRLRPARIRPLHALPGAHAIARPRASTTSPRSSSRC